METVDKYSKFLQFPVFSKKEANRNSIVDVAINFVKLITVTEQGGLKSDPMFGFRVLDYEFCPNIPHLLRTDLYSILENKMTPYSFISQQIENRLFYYFPESKDFINKVEVKVVDINSLMEPFQQQISVIIHFKLPESVSAKNRDEYKISLNKLRTILK